MRKILGFSVLAGLLALLVATAQAQRPGRFGGGGFGFGGPGALLNNKSVQEELKITDEQKTKIQEIAKESREKTDAILGKIDFQDKDNLKEAFAKRKEAAEQNKDKLMEIGQASEKAMLAVLDDGQKKRFKQIEIQSERLGAFQKEEVVKALNLADDQKEKIKTIAEDVNKDVGDLRKEAFTDKTGEARKKIAALNKEGMEKAVAVLNDAQKAKWKELTGDPFEVRLEGFGGGGAFGKRKQKDE
jgi:Spy/CpxP family protein refolding chaperone